MTNLIYINCVCNTIKNAFKHVYEIYTKYPKNIPSPNLYVVDHCESRFFGNVYVTSKLYVYKILSGILSIFNKKRLSAAVTNFFTLKTFISMTIIFIFAWSIRLGFKLLDVSVFIQNDDLFSLCTIVTASVGSIVRKYIDTFEFTSLNFSRDGAGSYFISRLKYVISCVKDLINNINPIKIPMGTDPDNKRGVPQADKGSHNVMMMDKYEGQPGVGQPGPSQPVIYNDTHSSSASNNDVRDPVKFGIDTVPGRYPLPVDGFLIWDASTSPNSSQAASTVTEAHMAMSRDVGDLATNLDYIKRAGKRCLGQQIFNLQHGTIAKAIFDNRNGIGKAAWDQLRPVGHGFNQPLTVDRLNTCRWWRVPITGPVIRCIRQYGQ